MINRILRKATYIKDDLLGGGYNFFYPESIQIETTIRCNLNCIICDDEMKTRTEIKNLQLDSFKNIVDQIKTLKEVNLTGFGESLLNPDIFEIIKYAKFKGLKTELASNCTLLNKDNARRLIESGLDNIIFSVDSGVPEEYNKIRVGTKFNLVRNNIENFLRTKEELRSDIGVQIYSVVIFSQLKNINKLIDLASNLGIGIINLRGLVNHNGREVDYSEEALYHPKNADKSEEVLSEAKKYASNKKIKLAYPSLFPINEHQCKMPSTRPFVSVEGLVTPCCVQGMDPRNVNFGNINKRSFKDIWNSQDYKKFRNDLYKNKDIPNICKYCPRLKGMA